MQPKTAADMRADIMLCMKANNAPVDGAVFFSLAFCSDAALRQICHELHISTKEWRRTP